MIENEKLLKSIKHLERQKNDVGTIGSTESLIEEVYKVMDFSSQKGNNLKNNKNKEVNIVKDVIETLRVGS
jgi:hypothetical protein